MKRITIICVLIFALLLLANMFAASAFAINVIDLTTSTNASCTDGVVDYIHFPAGFTNTGGGHMFAGDVVYYGVPVISGFNASEDMIDLRDLGSIMGYSGFFYSTDFWDSMDGSYGIDEAYTSYGGAGAFGVIGNTLNCNGSPDPGILVGAAFGTAAFLYNINGAITESNFLLPSLADTIPPAVSGISLSGSPAANATSVNYTVNFTEAITGLDVSDFTLTKTGTANGTVSSVSGSGSSYTVTVSSISGAGTLRLDLKSSGTGIIDASNNSISTGYTSGAARTVDCVVPTVGTITANNVTSAGATSYSFTVTYSDTGTGINSSSIGISNVTVTKSGGTVLTVTGASYNAGTSTATYTVTPPGGSWDAGDISSYTIAIVGSQVKDTAGNYVVGNGTAATFLVNINIAPTNSVVPALSGTVKVGNALSANTGTWSDADGDTLTYTYQWYRADDSSGTNVAVISGATNSSYTLTTSDAHKYIRVAVTADDGNGHSVTANSAWTQVVNTAPANSAAPAVSGTAAVSNALATTNGTWTDADGDSRTYSYQWYRADDSSGTNTVTIAGATSSSYSLTTSDAHKYIRVVVTANDGKGGTTSANSSWTQITNSAPANSVAPSVSGTAAVSNALTTTNGTWTDVDGDSRAYSYQWYRADDSSGTNAASISGATTSSYTLTTSDAHKYIRVVVTANDGRGGTTSASSSWTQIANIAPVNSVVPTVSGTFMVGNTLSASTGIWSDADGDMLTLTYQWYRANDSLGLGEAAISGATSSGYTLSASDGTKYLRVVVTANDGVGGTQTASSTRLLVNTNSAPTIAVNNGLTLDEDVVETVISNTKLFVIDLEQGAVSLVYTLASVPTMGTLKKSGMPLVLNNTFTQDDINNSRITYIPAANQNGTDGFNFTVSDGAGGSIGSTTFSINVAAINDAPVLVVNSTSLAPITEYDTSEAQNNFGDTVGSIAGSSISDIDSGAVKGIAVTGVNTGNGKWQYSTNSGSSWTDLGSVAESDALLLRATDKLRFCANGTDGTTAIINYRAWDQSSGSAGTKVNITATGASTAFSTATSTASIIVAAYNDAYVDINFSEGVYGAANGTSPVTPDKLTLIFSRNSGNATNITIRSVKKNDSTSESSASPLIGGEQIIRVFLSIIGTPSGLETIEIKPAGSTAIYDAIGNAVSTSQTTGVKTLKNKLLP